MASPLAGSPAERYLRSRAIPIPIHEPALRFHPSCYFKATEDGPRSTLPALLAAITDNAGSLTAVHRIWLLPDGSDKARLDAPRKTLGPQQGHAVRFGTPGPVLIAGEGIESVLSIRTLLPHLPAAAALSANHLAALILAPELKRLYIAQDNDPAGWRAARVLADAAHTAAIEPRLLNPSLDDWNTALREEGSQATLTRLCALLDPLDLPAF